MDQKEIDLSDPAVSEIVEDFRTLKISRHAAMRKLGIRWYGELLRLVGETGKDMKRIPNAEEERMAEEFARIIKESGK